MKKQIGLLLFIFLLGIQICMAQSLQIKGTVTDKKDKSQLPGVTVVIKGTTTGTATDVDGNYTISAKGTDVLIISYIGMKSQEIPVNNRTVINVELEEDTQSMDEVVVIGYGVRKKGSITGSVSTVKSDKLENIPTASFEQALQGQAPGLQVISGSGQPNSPATFTLRGTNSINAGSTPLFILDGMPITPSDFSSINSNDIANISVLKDASSTAIYGSRATNGVILITTKKGRMGEKARITARVQAGISNLAFGKWNVMNTKEKLDYEEEIGLHAGDPNYNRADWEGTNVDWRDAVFNNNAPLQSYELSVSGGSEKTNYYISGSVFDQEGIAYSTFFRRYSTRINVETKANNWLKIGANVSASYEQYLTDPFEGQPAINSLLGSATSMNPYWNPFRADGSIASMSDGSWKSQDYQNPLEFMNSADRSNNKAKFIGNAFVEISPISNLILRSAGGIDFSDLRSTVKNDPNFLPNNGEGSMGENFGRTYTLQISNTVDYSFDLNEIHQFRVLLGQEANYHEGNSFGIRGNGYTDKRLEELSLATSWSGGSSSKIITTYLSFFGRAEYNLREKYYFDATFRRDGSSRFGNNVKWGNFWSAGAMWNLTKESFLADNPIISNLQTSLTIGTQGNSQIPDYAYLATLGDFSYDGSNGLIPDNIGNPDLTWEKTLTFNWNVKVNLWDNVNLNLDVYNKRTTDMLMVVPFSMSSGFSTGWDNVGEMSNRGVDFDLNVTLLRNTDLTWNVGANFSYNKNKIKELYKGVDEYVDENEGIKYKVGHKLGEFFVNRFAGVNPANGDALWYTKDGEIINEFREADAVITGQSYIAPWSGGFSTALSYKGFNFSAQFSWMGERYVNNVDRYFAESNGRNPQLNQYKALLYDRWKEPGDITNIPRHGVYTQYDDRLLENVAFLRLKNVSLSYNFPRKWMEATRFVESMKIFGQAQNLLTFTKFKGLDPEIAGTTYVGHYPLSRQFTLGLEVNF